MPVYHRVNMPKTDFTFKRKFKKFSAQPFMYGIKLLGLPEHFELRALRSFLNGYLSVPCKLQVPPDDTLNDNLYGPSVYVNFRTEKDREKAVKLLAHKSWKGSALFAMVMKKTSPKKATLEMNNDVSMEGEKSPAESESEVKVEIKFENTEELQAYMRRRLTPLGEFPYEKQIAMKIEDTRKVIISLCSLLGDCNSILSEYFKKYSVLNEGLPAKVHDVKHLENEYDSYLSHCNFMIGKHVLTGEKIVGFSVEGSDGVAPLEDDLKTIPKHLLPIIRIFEVFIRTAGNSIKVFSSENKSRGHFKMLSFLYSPQTEQVMMIINFDPKKMNSVQINAVTQRVKFFYTSEDSAFDLLTSLHIKTGADDNISHLLGKQCIETSFGEVNFEVGPHTFFPENHWGCELLHNAIKDLCRNSMELVLIDVTGRNGTIGLPLAKVFSSVLIIESSEKSRKETERVAKTNGISNCEVVAGNINYFFSEAVKNIEKNNLCIFDITRSKLQEHGITLIKLAPNITKILFLAAKNSMFEKELKALVSVTPGVTEDETFTLSEIVPIDTAPHTEKYELLLVFERLKFVRSNCSTE